MIDRVRRYIDLHRMIEAGETVLVGVSGGIDSMVLLHILLTLDVRVEVAHVNYQVRGDESNADELLVSQYCEDRNIPCHVFRPDPIEEKKGDSFQEIARSIRYGYFETKACERSIKRVAVAHHLDDQAETVLLKLFTGSGIEGLSGMAPVRQLGFESENILLRPLLECTRSDIAAYAAAQGVSWREDRTNAGIIYRRNVLRNLIMPLVEEHFGPFAPAHIARSASILKGYWEHTVRPELVKRLNACMAHETGINIKALQNEPSVWRKRIVLEVLYRWQTEGKVTMHTVEAILNLVDVQVGRKVVISGGVIWRERDQLVFKPDAECRHDYYLLDVNTAIRFSEGGLQAQLEVPEIDPPVIMDRNVIVADRSRLSFPLLLRRWRSGDRMVPFGMQGRKKVSDILTDAKVPTSSRETVHVLESAGEVVWVVGVRMADTIKLDEMTEEVVRITFIPKS